VRGAYKNESHLKVKNATFLAQKRGGVRPDRWRRKGRKKFQPGARGDGSARRGFPEKKEGEGRKGCRVLEEGGFDVTGGTVRGKSDETHFPKIFS